MFEPALVIEILLLEVSILCFFLTTTFGPLTLGLEPTILPVAELVDDGPVTSFCRTGARIVFDKPS
jgi:hypothetical protein